MYIQHTHTCTLFMYVHACTHTRHVHSSCSAAWVLQLLCWKYSDLCILRDVHDVCIIQDTLIQTCCLATSNIIILCTCIQTYVRTCTCMSDTGHKYRGGGVSHTTSLISIFCHKPHAYDDTLNPPFHSKVNADDNVPEVFH